MASKKQIAKRSDSVGRKSITIPCPLDPNKYFGSTLWEQVQYLPQNQPALEWINWWLQPQDLNNTVLIFPWWKGVTKTQVNGVPCFSVSIQKGNWLSKLFGSDWRNIYYHPINKQFREEFPDPDRIDVQFKDGQKAIIYVPLKRTLPELPPSAMGEKICQEVSLDVCSVHQGNTTKANRIPTSKTPIRLIVRTGETLPPLSNGNVSKTIENVPIKILGDCTNLKGSAKLEITVIYDAVEQKTPEITLSADNPPAATINLPSVENGQIDIKFDNKGMAIVSSTSILNVKLGNQVFDISHDVQPTQLTLKINVKQSLQVKTGVLLTLTHITELEISQADLLKLIECKPPELRTVFEKVLADVKIFEEYKPIQELDLRTLTIIVFGVAIIIGLAIIIPQLSYPLVPYLMTATAYASPKIEENHKNQNISIPLCAILKEFKPAMLSEKNAITVIPNGYNFCLPPESKKITI